MRCENCGIPLNSSSDYPRMLRRWKPEDWVSVAMNAPVATTATITTSPVCSAECAKLLSERWQNEDLAEDIGRALKLDHWPVASVATLIRGHRERWSKDN